MDPNDVRSPESPEKDQTSGETSNEQASRRKFVSTLASVAGVTSIVGAAGLSSAKAAAEPTAETFEDLKSKLVEQIRKEVQFPPAKPFLFSKVGSSYSKN